MLNDCLQILGNFLSRNFGDKIKCFLDIRLPHKLGCADVVDTSNVCTIMITGLDTPDFRLAALKSVT